jgi:hypothetical protein
MDSWAKDDFKVSLAVVADRISRTTILGPIRIGPALVQWAVPREASLARTLLGAFTVGDGISANANVAIATLHNGKIVSSTIHTGILTVAKFEKSLCLPLTSSAPFGVTGKTHTEIFEGSGDGELLLGRNVRWLRALEHLEVSGDLVEGNLLGEFAVVPDVDVESARVALDESVFDWRCCCRQGEQRSEKPARSVHVIGRSDCGGISELKLLSKECAAELIQYACIKRVAISRDIKVWLCSLFDAKDMANSSDNGTIETMTFYSWRREKLSRVNEGG